MNKTISNRSRFVTAGHNVIKNHVNNAISNPMEVVNIKDGIKSVEDFID